tara:strand:- start:115 stop:630 length:516 start_codon:yes stop_codon:yes gene_type:complete
MKQIVPFLFLLCCPCAQGQTTLSETQAALIVNFNPITLVSIDRQQVQIPAPALISAGSSLLHDTLIVFSLLRYTLSRPLYSPREINYQIVAPPGIYAVLRYSNNPPLSGGLQLLPPASYNAGVHTMGISQKGGHTGWESGDGLSIQLLLSANLYGALSATLQQLNIIYQCY